MTGEHHGTTIWMKHLKMCLSYELWRAASGIEIQTEYTVKTNDTKAYLYG